MIIDLFFDEILKEASIGRVDAVMMYNVLFETKVNGKYLYKASDNIKNNNDLFIPCLEINNLEEFNNLLIDYYNKASDFYKGTLDEDINYDKAILTLLWNNATSEDFKNPNKYIKRYIDFLDNKLEINNSKYSEILECNIESSIEKEPIYEETPYALHSVCTNGESTYDLPVVRFGISDDKAYIYAVQQMNNKKEPSSFEKKIKRKLFKVNDSFEKEDNIDNIEYPENLTGINPGALVALSILFSNLENINVKEVIVPTFLPVRFNAKEISFEVKRNILKNKGYTEDNLDNMILQLKNQHEEIQRNLSDKLLRNIRRIEYNFNNISIYSYPHELDENTHINISEYEDCKNKLLKEIYEINLHTKEDLHEIHR